MNEGTSTTAVSSLEKFTNALILEIHIFDSIELSSVTHGTIKQTLAFAINKGKHNTQTLYPTGYCTEYRPIPMMN